MRGLGARSPVFTKEFSGENCDGHAVTLDLFRSPDSETQFLQPYIYIYTFMNGLGSFTMTLNLPFSGFDLVVILEKTLIYRCLTAMFFTPSHLHQCSTCMRKCATVRLARLTSSRSMRARFEQIGGRCKLVEEDQVRSCSLEEVDTWIRLSWKGLATWRMAFYFQHVVLGRGFAEERRRHGYVNSFAHHVIAGRMLPSLRFWRSIKSKSGLFCIRRSIQKRFFAGFGSGLFASCQLRESL